MLCKCYWIVLHIVHVTAFCLGGRFFPDTVYMFDYRPRRFVTFYISALEILLLTYLLTYCINGHFQANLGKPVAPR